MKKRLIPILCGVAMLLSMLCTAGAAAVQKEEEQCPDDIWAAIEYEETPGSEPVGRIALDGKVGDRYLVGDLIFEIVSEEEVEKAVREVMPASSVKLFDNITLSGDRRSEPFEVTERYPYAKVWVSLKADSGDVRFNITKTSPTGYVVKGSDVEIRAGQSVTIRSTKKWDADLYFANFTSGEADMVGTAACRIASTLEEIQ